DLSVVAEGVETLEQLKILKTFHCDYIQGYLTAKPMNLEELEQLFGTITLKNSLIEKSSHTTCDY
ncbi:hypothetical protein CIK04_27990, partial [Vibrio sp. 03_296]|uniref:EAL domain-containing protein n=1 Tax=Vibrio sp. 03_296 TaxID=2024409 RepID=UPI000BC73F64